MQVTADHFYSDIQPGTSHLADLTLITSSDNERPHMKTIAIAFVALLPFTVAMAENRATHNSSDNQYRYGMNLNIARVISITDTAKTCGLVPVTMNYEDDQGERHSLRYNQLNAGPGCPDN